MLVVTTNDIPGWRIERVCGEVFGLTVRSRNVFSQMGAGFKSMFGGELAGMTKNLADSRNEVMARMLEHARSKGGNAVVAMRFDTSEMGDVWTELCAYGTAVVAVPEDEGARLTAAQLGYSQPGGSPAIPDAVQPYPGQYAPDPSTGGATSLPQPGGYAPDPNYPPQQYPPQGYPQQYPPPGYPPQH
jgi:uncharacterized protein YbjQ (UPF0145 family)